MLTRRETLLGAVALSACAPTATETASSPPEPIDDPRFAAIEQRIGGRLGVAAWNTGTDAWLVHRANERFAMCSMFKWLLGAQMLRIDQDTSGFRDQHVRFGAADLEGLGLTPVTTANLQRGWMTVLELAEAATVQSDNGAANLLLARANGPEGFTSFLRSNGDGVTRLDRTEPALNENLPGDERDTSTPDAMARSMQHFLLTDSVLNPASRATLTGWLIACQTGLDRLRGGFPDDWRAGDKTGTSDSEHNATTDVAIAWPPGRAPIVVACFLSESTVPLQARKDAHAEVARIVAEVWA